MWKNVETKPLKFFNRSTHFDRIQWKFSTTKLIIRANSFSLKASAIIPSNKQTKDTQKICKTKIIYPSINFFVVIWLFFENKITKNSYSKERNVSKKWILIFLHFFRWRNFPMSTSDQCNWGIIDGRESKWNLLSNWNGLLRILWKLRLRNYFLPLFLKSL